MNLRRRLLRFHPPTLRNAPKSSVWSSHLPPPFRTLRFHPPDRSATAKTNEALNYSSKKQALWITGNEAVDLDNRRLHVPLC
ncbi:hypothetical protein KSP40_PGU003123 [Platanthera guangdongensis]|uniref:Uncharacterized protein n=1 Tax=Platanthera guangdongensis TaxID=2320717 RepID=A0ABR2N280_9ASPA